jgi:hypothetical protein
MVVGDDFISYKEAYEYLSEEGIMCVKPLVIGKFGKVSQFSHIFDSTIPKILGLSPPPAGTNLAEGIVIRPYDVASPGYAYKVKHPDFREVKRSFREAGGEGEDLWREYATRNRYNNLISKHGPCNGDLDKLCEYFVDDVIESYYETESIPIKNYDKAVSVIQRIFKEF